MIRLNSVRVDPKVRETGTWVDLAGADFQGARVKSRGFTDEYTDARAAALRREAIKYGDDQARIPNSRVRSIVIDALEAHVLVDVSGITHDDGRAVTLPEFIGALREPGYEEMYVAVTNAVALAGRTKLESAQEAAGN